MTPKNALTATITTALTGLALLAAGCGGKDDRTAGSQEIDYPALVAKAKEFTPSIGTRGGTLILSLFSEPVSLNPITATTTSERDLVSLMYEGLVRISGTTRQPEPNLAKGWDVSDNGRVWTFHLRDSVLWSDGEPFTAEDVEFTFNDVIYNEKITPNPTVQAFLLGGERIEVDVLDDHTVQFSLPAPYAPFLRAMAQEIVPKHAYGKLVQNNLFAKALGMATQPERMVGTGPFMLESYLPSERIVFTRNPNYWKHDSDGNRLPYLERVEYQVFADRSAEFEHFVNGNIDFLAAQGGDFDRLKEGETDGGYTVHRLGPATGSSFLLFNQNTGADSVTGEPYVDSIKRGWFRNQKFRAAVAHAIDREGIIRDVMDGLGYPQWSPMTPSEGRFYNPDVTTYEYNLRKARSLLEGEGFKDRDGDGTVEDSAGNPVAFNLYGAEVRSAMAGMIQRHLEQLGFEVNLTLMDFDTLVERVQNPPYEWEAMLLALTGGPEPHARADVWHSSGNLHLWFPRQKSPSTAWEARIDSLFEAGVREVDPAGRKRIYDEWQRIAADKLPCIYTVVPERIYAISSRLRNINPSPAGVILHNLEWVYIAD